jgi:hypothetical protein
MAEFLDHLGIAEIAGSGIACAAERDRADMGPLSAVQERLGPCDDRAVELRRRRSVE